MTLRDKKLYRSKTKKILGGVCGGLEDYTGIDTVLWRVIFVLLCLPGGLPGVIPYLIMWIIVPPEPARKQVVNKGS